jgi:Domain of unknown function (DUF4082)
MKLMTRSLRLIRPTTFNPFRTSFAGLVCAALLCPLANQAKADVFFTPSAFSIGTSYTTPQSFGDTFTPTENITVTSLGFFDINGSLTDPHNVGIFNSSGTPLADTTVPPGTGGTLVGDFSYVSITPLNLTAGDTYTLAGLLLTTDDPVGYSSPGGVTLGSGLSVSLDPAVYVFAGGPSVNDLVDPTFSGISATFYVGPNFEYGPSNANGVPDAGSWTSVVLAAGFLASLRRKT